MTQIYFTGLRCEEETNEVGADEPYLLVTSVDLAPPTPTFEVSLFGPFADVDRGDFRAGPGNTASFWGITGAPSLLEDPEKAIFVVAMMENDDGNPSNLRGIVKGLVGSSVLGSLNLPRREKVAKLINDIRSGVRTPTGAPNFDDPVGDPQELQFSADELRRAGDGSKIGKGLVFAGDGGRYAVTFEAHNPMPRAGQADWRFCNKCRVMSWDGAPDKGACAAGGAHTAQGFMFVLPFNLPETSTRQIHWRFCEKCRSMFWNGDPANKGVCPRGGQHVAQGFNFALPHDTAAAGQRDWRFCQNCRAMFWNGDPNNRGVCPRGGPHVAQGFNFVLPFVP